jgi:hypothetical protein|tara:strand:+ start:457 stop:666 length:210 start_codon:yes stop_codon:yes gene_type:complete
MAKFKVTFQGSTRHSDGTPKEKEWQIVFNKTGFPRGNTVGMTCVFETVEEAEKFIQNEEDLAREINYQA